MLRGEAQSGRLAIAAVVFRLFYETKGDLLDTSMSYGKAGLESEESFLWVVAAPLTIEEAKDALTGAGQCREPDLPTTAPAPESHQTS